MWSFIWNLFISYYSSIVKDELEFNNKRIEEVLRAAKQEVQSKKELIAEYQNEKEELSHQLKHSKLSQVDIDLSEVHYLFY